MLKAFVVATIVISLVLMGGCRDKQQETALCNDWVFSRCNNERWSSTGFDVPTPLKITWTERYEQNPSLSSPVISGSKMIVATGSKLRCLNRNTGMQFWEHSFPNCIVHYPCIIGQRVIFIVATVEGNYSTGYYPGAVPSDIACIEMSSGSVIWTKRLEEGMYWLDILNYCANESSIYIMSNTGSLYIYSTATGDYLGGWKIAPDKYFAGSMILHEGKLYFALGDKRLETRSLYSYSVTDKTVVWKRDFTYSVFPGCLYNDTIVVVPSSCDRNQQTALEDETEQSTNSVAVTALDRASGDSLWEYLLEPKVRSLVPYDGVAYSGDDSQLLFFGSYSGSDPVVQVINARNGKRLWSKNLRLEKAGRLLCPIITGNSGWLVSSRGVQAESAFLYGFNLKTGNVIDKIRQRGVISIARQ